MWDWKHHYPDPRIRGTVQRSTDPARRFLLIRSLPLCALHPTATSFTPLPRDEKLAKGFPGEMTRHQPVWLGGDTPRCAQGPRGRTSGCGPHPLQMKKAQNPTALPAHKPPSQHTLTSQLPSAHNVCLYVVQQFYGLIWDILHVRATFPKQNSFQTDLKCSCKASGVLFSFTYHILLGLASRKAPGSSVSLKFPLGFSPPGQFFESPLPRENILI